MESLLIFLYFDSVCNVVYKNKNKKLYLLKHVYAYKKIHVCDIINSGNSRHVCHLSWRAHINKLSLLYFIISLFSSNAGHRPLQRHAFIKSIFFTLIWDKLLISVVNNKNNLLKIITFTSVKIKRAKDNFFICQC